MVCVVLQVRAWDFDKPLLVAPAMNTFMWDSPFTSKHLKALQDLGASVIPPVSVAHGHVLLVFQCCRKGAPLLCLLRLISILLIKCR